MTAKSFKDLIVWQKAFQLTEQIYRFTNNLPESEKFSLTAQIRRSAISICSNIAEGYERNNRKEYLHFLSLARGSSAELEAQLLLAQRIYGLEVEAEVALLTEAQKLLWVFNKNLRLTPSPQPPSPIP